jgi:RimJ/RimL family protein N-acetyltransferase
MCLTPGDPEWPFYLFVDEDQAMVVGSGGFTCSPDSRGEVQIGYEVAPAFRGQGIATRMMRMVLARHPQARPIAFTSGDSGSSAAVLRKLGFSSTGYHRLENDVTVWRWSRSPRI